MAQGQMGAQGGYGEQAGYGEGEHGAQVGYGYGYEAQGYGGFEDGVWGQEQAQEWEMQRAREAQEAQAAQAAEQAAALERRRILQQEMDDQRAVAASERDYPPNLNFRAPQGAIQPEMTRFEYNGVSDRSYGQLDSAWRFVGGNHGGQVYGTNPRRGPSEFLPTPGWSANTRCDMCGQIFSNAGHVRVHRRVAHGSS